MESQPQNPEFRNNPENFHPCTKISWLGPNEYGHKMSQKDFKITRTTKKRHKQTGKLYSSLASGNLPFLKLLIPFGSNLDPDQARQNVGSDLDPNHLTLILLLKEIFEKVNFEKSEETPTKA